MNKYYILNFTPTGMIPTKEMTPEVPISVAEIVEQVLQCAELGVNMVHVHARDPITGIPTSDKDIYADIIKGIRQKNKQLVICTSTSGRNFPEFERRSACLDLTGDLKPDFGSLTLGSMNFNRQASVNSPDMIQALAKKMLDNCIKPELEVFDLGMINYAHYLIKKGLIKPPYYFTLLLGNVASAQANLMTLGMMINELPPDSYWSVGGMGSFQLPMNAIGVISGGGVRVGLEDNIYFDDEKNQLASNSDLVRRVIDIARSVGKMPYSPVSLRSLLGLN
jgi:3-keto-5-aminohexanoate cleavage enzyme